MRLLLAFQVFAGLAALTVAPPLIQEFLGPEYGDAASLTRALAPWVVLAGLTPIATNTLDYLGRARQRLPFAVAAVTVNALIDVILLPRVGVVAAAIGTDAGIAVFTLGALWICSRALGYRLNDFAEDIGGVAFPAAAALAIMVPVAVATTEVGLLVAALVIAGSAFSLIVLGRDGIGRLGRLGRRRDG